MINKEQDISEQLESTELGMSNFDQSIDEGLEEALKTDKVYAQHSAYDFCGLVWFENGLFYEQVFEYRSISAVHMAETLKALMEKVNDKYGYE